MSRRFWSASVNERVARHRGLERGVRADAAVMGARGVRARGAGAAGVRPVARCAPQKDVAIVVVDDSPSMEIGDRRKQAEQALAQLQDRLKSDPDVAVRVV